MIATLRGCFEAVLHGGGEIENGRRSARLPFVLALLSIRNYYFLFKYRIIPDA